MCLLPGLTASDCLMVAWASLTWNDFSGDSDAHITGNVIAEGVQVTTLLVLLWSSLRPGLQKAMRDPVETQVGNVDWDREVF